MPGIIFGHRVQECPVIPCKISFPSSAAEGKEPESVTLNALIDTGATHLVISPATAERLQLPVVGEKTSHVVGASRTVKTYRCDVVLTGQGSAPPNNQFMLRITDVEAVCETITEFDAVLGWDILNKLNLHFHSDRSFMVHLPSSWPVPEQHPPIG